MDHSTLKWSLMELERVPEDFYAHLERRILINTRPGVQLCQAQGQVSLMSLIRFDSGQDWDVEY